MTATARPGVFVAIEGGDGAGKSTVAAAVGQWFANAGVGVTVTREPGGTALADLLRSHVLADDTMTPTTELLAFLTARADHVAKVIKPALAAGHLVIVDRFHDSTLVYQGIARGHGLSRVDRLSRWACGERLPDLTVLLDVEAHEGLTRASDHNRMEAEGIDFHRTVTSAFREIAAADPNGHVVIDAHQPVDQVVSAVVEAVQCRVNATAELV